MAETDQLGRPVQDLRVSLTDRCNFRCTYCMPREIFGPDYQFLSQKELLAFDEIARIARVFARMGVGKVRLTGGEPLLRQGIEDLIARLAAIEGIEDLSLTTNASLLAGKAETLRHAGLNRVNVSLDSVDNATFRQVSDVNVSLQRVLEGLEAAQRAGLEPVKVNAVIQRGVTDDGIEDLAAFARARGYTLRFIEYMDVGNTNGWKLDDVVPAREIVDRLEARWPLEAIEPAYPGEVAERYRYRDGAGEVGVIASVTQPFCGTCTRARLSAQGELFTCLFASQGQDLRGLLRRGADDAELEASLRGTWAARTDRYSQLRAVATTSQPKVEMSYIGG
jgi:cyclic pyranopterin phosphate synthase